MTLLRNHLFLSTCQLLASAVVLVIQLTAVSWQRSNLLGKIATPVPIVFMLVAIALIGHYYLRKQILVSAWGYSILFPLITAAFLYYGLHVISRF